MEPSTLPFEPLSHRVEVYIDGTDLAELFEEAGYALADLQFGGQQWELPPDAEEEHVTLEAPDTECLLILWLNALISRSGAGGKVYGYFLVDELAGRKLHARIRGYTPSSIAVTVKSATFRGLELREHDDGFTATLPLIL